MIVRDTLPNFSLIIPTKDRFEILRDTLNFYCDNSYSEDIYIVDSTEEKIHQKISSFISTLPSNIKLLRYDGLGVSNAIMFALDEMDRVYEYVMQVSDDDLFIKSKKVKERKTV